MRVKIESFIREVCEKTTKNNEYPVLTSSKSGLFLQRDYFNKQVASTDNTGYKIIKRGQFTYRAMSDTGEFYPNMLECVDVGIVSPAYPVFEIFQADLIIPEYLKYFFKSNAFQHSISSFAQGSTRTSVKFNKLKTVSIDLPSKQEQVNILLVLKKTDDLIAYHQQQLQKLNELVKSRFIELFGNFVYEHDRWSICEIGDVADTIDPQPSHRTPPVSSDGVPYIGIAECNYKTLKIDFANARKVGQDILQEHLNRYTINKGDFIIGKIGTIGKPFFLPTKQTYTLSANTVLIKPNKQKVEPQFLFAVFQSEYMERIIDAEKKSTSQSAFGIQKVRNIDIPMPPMELQQQFAAFVEQTDKSKLAVQKGLQELEILKKSLMQQYFG